MSVFIELCVCMCMCAFTLTSLMIAWLRGVDWCSKRTPDWQQCVLLAFHLEATVAFCVCICVCICVRVCADAISETHNESLQTKRGKKENSKQL